MCSYLEMTSAMKLQSVGPRVSNGTPSAIKRDKGAATGDLKLCLSERDAELNMTFMQFFRVTSSLVGGEEKGSFGRYGIL